MVFIEGGKFLYCDKSTDKNQMKDRNRVGNE